MAPEQGFFEAFYASPAQHPALLWAAAALATLAALRRPGLAPSLRRYLLALGLLSLADAWTNVTVRYLVPVDAWLTANQVPVIGRLDGVSARAVPLFFVLAGDFRFLLLLGAADASGRFRLGARAVGGALALALVVPLVSQAVVLGLGREEPRVLFLVYELAFFALTVALLRGHPGLHRAPWLASVCRFVLLYYGLWAAADAVILTTGSDLGFALRVVPNVLYYGGLIAAIAWAAPLPGGLEPDARPS